MSSPTAVGSDVYVIDADYVRPRVAAIHLLRSGREVALVDTGVNASVSGVLSALSALGHAPSDVRYVILTHIHLDHAGGASAMMGLFPSATLVVHPRGARHMADPSRLIAGSIAVYGESTYRRLYGDIVPIDADRIHATTDGERLSLGDRPLSFIHTPGHARHHHCVLDLSGDGVFTGDTFGLSYRVFDVSGAPFIFPTTSPVHFDPSAAHASIDRIVSSGLRSAYLTHYSRVTDLSRLSKDLHSDLDVFVDLTVQSSDVSELEHRLWEHLSARLESHGYRGPESERQTWLSLDVRLNAQGLWFWREHRR